MRKNDKIKLPFQPIGNTTLYMNNSCYQLEANEGYYLKHKELDNQLQAVRVSISNYNLLFDYEAIEKPQEKI